MFKYILVGKENISLQVNAEIDFNPAKSTVENYFPLENKTSEY